MASLRCRFIEVVGAVSGLVLACGGATRETVEHQAAGGGAAASAGAMLSAGARAPAGQGGVAGLAENATAGAPHGDQESPMCFKPEQLPELWYENGGAGARSSECPVAPERLFSVSICYFELSDLGPTSPPPGHAGECCYWLRFFHCR